MKNNEFLPFAFFEGKIIPTDLAKVSIMTSALQYGNSVFGGLRGYRSSSRKNFYIFRPLDHYSRLLSSLKILNKKIPYSVQELVAVTVELAQKNKPSSDFYIRPLSYAANYELSPDMSRLQFDLAIYMIPLGEYLSISKGLKLIISNWTRINDNMIPSRGKISGGYVNSSLAKGDASLLGFDDALMLDKEGHLSEASAANFFMVRENKLPTSPKYTDVLEGVTRRTILKLALDLGIPTVERMIDRTEIYIADEAFLTGTGAQIAWIKEVDNRQIGTGRMGPVTSKIQKLFFNIVRGNQAKYSSWLKKI